MRNERPSTLDVGLLVLRLGFGGLMLGHGLPKAANLFSGDPSFADPIGVGELPTLALAVFAEVVCALLVMVGLKVRWAAIPLIATMAVAAFVVNADDPFGGGESALLFLVGFLTLVFTGAGRLSVDAWWRRRRR